LVEAKNTICRRTYRSYYNTYWFKKFILIRIGMIVSSIIICIIL
jgi:hypothetical protein